MPNIVQLSAHVADLIAAGEVVERPASVVKELLENSIDAGAKNVTVEIQNGGMTLLRVMDDGCGIAPEDAETAFLRHATSKIRKKEDLEAIGTLGFRGEALAATAAVSKIDLLTRTADAEEGIRLHLEAGKVFAREPAGCPVGTTLIVRDLFYNTPARMKFMKQDSVEASAVFSAVQKQALAHPEVSVRFIKDGTEQLHTPGDGDLQAAIYSVLGRQLAMDMVEVSSGWEQLKLTGYVTKPTATRGNRSQQIFFINRRYVRSKTLTAALEEAYRNQIMVGRFPSCVLNIEMPLSAVDVNVHPAKTEVKFLNEREVFDTVHYGVLAALNRTSGRVEMKLPAQKQSPQPVILNEVKDLPSNHAETVETRSFADAQDDTSYGRSEGTKKLPTTAAPTQPVILREQTRPKDLPANTAPAPKKDFYRAMDAQEYKSFLTALTERKPVTPSEGIQKAVFGKQTAQPKVEDTVYTPQPTPQPKTEEAPQSEQTAIQPETSPYRVIGETLNTYILVEQDEALLLIDKHAAHERILFEKLKKQPQEVMGQYLLAPLTCELDREDAAILVQNRALLLTLGYDLDDAGDGTLLLRQIPADLDTQGAESNLAELAEHLKQGKQDRPDTVRDSLLHSIACKAAIKAGWQTDEVSRAALVKEVLSREDIKYCPHGRPICVTLAKKQLEKQFKRIQ